MEFYHMHGWNIVYVKKATLLNAIIGISNQCRFDPPKIVNDLKLYFDIYPSTLPFDMTMIT